MLDTGLVTMVARGDASKVAELLSKGARVDVRDRGFTPLLIAAGFGHTEVCELLLDQGKANIEETEPLGENSALNQAASTGNASTVALLLSKGARVDTRNKSGDTPLLIAAQFGQTEVCELLLEKGKANIEEAGSIDETALSIAARSGDAKTVALLLSKGARVDTRDKNRDTPFLAAAEEGHTEVCELLLAKGSNLEESNAGQFTALHKAAACRDQSLLLLLLSHKANVNSRSRTEATPLHTASQEGHLTSVVALLQAGADPLLAQNDGALPIHLAYLRNNSDVVRILVDQGGCSPDQVTTAQNMYITQSG